MVAFCLINLTTSNGKRKSDCSGRYLEIEQFPEDGRLGKGRYIADGRIRSAFTFTGGENGLFESKQRNGRAFHLAPVITDDMPTGFVWTMPEEYPKFRATFGCSVRADEFLREFSAEEKVEKWDCVKSKFAPSLLRKLSIHRKCSVRRLMDSQDQTTQGYLKFQRWQERFRSRRKSMCGGSIELPRQTTIRHALETPRVSNEDEDVATDAFFEENDLFSEESVSNLQRITEELTPLVMPSMALKSASDSLRSKKGKRKTKRRKRKTKIQKQARFGKKKSKKVLKKKKST